MYCSECGSKLSQDAKFCYKCGAQIVQVEKDDRTKIASSDDKRVTVSRTTHTQGIKCPQCNKDDKVQKVTAIVAGQRHEISGGSWNTQVYIDKEGKKRSEDHYVPYSATQMSVLAQHLSPPTEPDAGSNTGGIVGTIGLLGVAALCGCMGLSAGEQSVGLIVGAIVLGIVGVGVFISTNNNYKERLDHVQRVEKPRWRRAKERWDKLYYCSRDDIVFIPSENKSVPLYQMTDYIFQETATIAVGTPKFSQGSQYSKTEIKPTSKKSCPHCGKNIPVNASMCIYCQEPV